MDSDYLAIITHLFGALVAGAVIGLERSYHARPAGFRTHTLVCLSSSLLMLVTMYQSEWLPSGLPVEAINSDPTRMAQGIMTGIGFLGAGVIFKEGLSVRGLTTAASIWMTSAIGILMGIGFYFPAIVATAMTLGILSMFRWIENKMPSHNFVHHHLRFSRHDAASEDDVRKLLQQHGFIVSNLSYGLSDDGQFFDYRMMIRGARMDSLPRLAEKLRSWDRVKSFQLTPTGD